jgi:hypothetical protein
VNDLTISPWHVLNIDISNAIREDFDFNNLINESTIRDLWPYNRETISELFSAEWLAYMNEIGLPPDSATIFYRSPFFEESMAHVDLFQNPIRPAVFALNWVVSEGDDSEMIWFDTPDTPGEYIMYDATEVGSRNMSWPMSSFDGKHMYRRTLGKQLTLVATGRPHNIIVNKIPRWCISVRFSTRTFNIQSWEEAIAHFSKFIVKAPE